MDAKEALIILKSHPVWCTAYPAQKCDEATELAISALEKVETLEAENARLRERETPKEPVQKEDSAYGWAWYCPNCGVFIDPSTYKHCPECGQAIKNDKE